MPPNRLRPRPPGPRHRRPSIAALRRFRPHLDPLEPRALLATLTVTAGTDAGPGSLRAAIASAGSGDTITFAPSLAGRKITLTSGPLSITRDLKIVGPTGPSLTNISAGGVGTIFSIRPANLTLATPPIDVSIVGLEIADGASTSGGGGIEAVQANLTLADDAVINNQTIGSTDIGGGGVSVEPGSYALNMSQAYEKSVGSLAVYGTTFQGNRSAVFGGALLAYETPVVIVTDAFTDNGAEEGGAIDDHRQANVNAVLTISGTRFTGNRADNPASATGGAVHVEGGPATVAESWFGGNVADGIEGGSGGAIFGTSGAALAIRGSTFVANRAEGTVGESSGFGGALSDFSSSPLTIDGSTFLGNVAQGHYDAEGGAVSSGGVAGKSVGTTITNSTFSANQALGLPPASPNVMESSDGGGVYAAETSLVINNVHFLGNQAVGGLGGGNGPGGEGIGGGLLVTTVQLTVTDSLFSGNLAQGGAGSEVSNGTGPSSGGGGFAGGGGIATTVGPPAAGSSISNTQLVANSAVGGAGIGASAAGGLADGGGLSWFGNPLTMTTFTATGNSAIGGAGGPAGTTAGSKGGQGGQGGPAIGGGIQLQSAQVTITGGRFASNTARGGDSPAGVAGTAQGGGISGDAQPAQNAFAINSLTLSGVVLASNMAIGGSGNSGGPGEGGGVYVAGIVSIAVDNITANTAQGGPSGQGLGGGVYEAPAIKSTIDKASQIAGNRASTSGNDLYNA